MLTAAGPGIDALLDYTNRIDIGSIQIKQVQGDPLDEYDCTIWDYNSSAPIAAEDDIVALDESDPNGWPTVQLLFDPGFEGTFSGGVDNAWTLNGATGVTASKQTTNLMNGSAAQKLAFSSVASGHFVTVTQQQALPSDSNGNALVDMPYTFSAWVRFDTGWAGQTGAYFYVQIEWQDSSGSTVISSATTQLNYLADAVHYTAERANAWYRLNISATPPANAVYALCVLGSYTGSATVTSANLYWDDAQLERNLFQMVAIANPTPPVLNTSLNSHGGGSLADDWEAPVSSDQTGTATYSIVSSPSLNGGQSQQIALTNARTTFDNNEFYIQQGYVRQIPVSRNMAYTARMTYQVTSTLSNAQVIFQIGFLDGNGNWLGSASVTGLLNEASGTDWRQQTITFGISQAHGFPANTVSIVIIAGLGTTNATNSGTIVIGQCNVTPFPLSVQPYPERSWALAGNAGVYPTAFCDTNIPGCWFDGAIGLYYRQLRLFAGFVKTAEADYFGPTREIKVISNDYTVLFDEAPANLRINAQQDYLAIKALGDYASNQGFLAGVDYQTHVQNVDTIDAMVINWETSRDVMSKISEHTVSAWWVDYYKYLWYLPNLANIAPFELSDTPDGVTSFQFYDFQMENDSTESATQAIIEGNNQISAPITYTANGTGAQTVFTINGGFSVERIDACTVGGVSQAVGLFSVNAYTDGYTALLDPPTGKLYFQTAPPSGTGNVVVVFRYDSPVLTRIRAPKSETSTRRGKKGSIRRKIHVHHKQTHVSSKATAIDDANSKLSQHSTPQAVGQAVIRTPPAPVASLIRPGMAIHITYQAAGYVRQLFQIVEIDITVEGMGQIVRTMKLGWYRPTFATHVHHSRREAKKHASKAGSDTILSDVLSVDDGWTITDNITPTAHILNVGVWGNPTTSTWDGTAVWG